MVLSPLVIAPMLLILNRSSKSSKSMTECNLSSSSSLKIVPRTWFGFKAIQFTVGNLYLVCTFLLMVIAPSGACMKPAGGGGITAEDTLAGGGGGQGGGGGMRGTGGGGGITGVVGMENASFGTVVLGEDACSKSASPVTEINVTFC